MQYIEQEEEAKRFIHRYGKTWMLYDDDAIGEIIETAMNARLKYNPNHETQCKLSSYLIKSVKRKMIRLHNKRCSFFTNSIPDMATIKSKDNGILDFIKTTQCISDSEKDIVIFYFFHNMTFEEIGNKLGVSKQCIHQRMNILLNKLKGQKNVLVEK